MDSRKTEIYTNDNWQAIDFQQIKKGDTFRLFESTGEAVIGGRSETEWIAMSNAFLIDDGVWTVDINS